MYVDISKLMHSRFYNLLGYWLYPTINTALDGDVIWLRSEIFEGVRTMSVAKAERLSETKAPANLIFKFAKRLLNTARLRPHAAMADYFLASFPKSGRTWLRFLLSHYLAAVSGEEDVIDLVSMFSILPNFDLDPIRGIPAFRFAGSIERVPKIWVTHLAYDKRLFLDKPMVLIVRDPRDVMVSAFFHATRHKHRFEGQILDFIRDEAIGASAMCRYLNGWATGISERRSHVVSYEALYADPEGELIKTLTFLDLPIISSAVKSAVAAGDFSAMQVLEMQQGMPGHNYDRSDPDSRRMRRGMPGGFVDYLDGAALGLLEEICRHKLSAAAKSLVKLGVPAPRQ